MVDILFFILFFSLPAFAQDPCKPDPIKDYNLSQIATAISSDLGPECQAPSPGTFKDIDIDEWESPTGVVHAYRLGRTTAGDFEITFNIKFFSDSGTSPRKVDSVLTAKWRSKAAECLRNPDLKAIGPDGEKVVFKIYDGPDDDSAPPLTTIGMRDSGRGHSKSWIQDFGCSTILHELLHLAGLVDEYPESSMGYVKDPNSGGWKFVQTNAERTAFDCRKMYEKNSIMASDTVAWANVFAEWDLRIDFCACDQDDGCKMFFDEQKKQFEKFLQHGPSTSKIVKVSYPNQCPNGFKRSEHFLEYPVPEEIKKQHDAGISMGFGQPSGMAAEDVQKMLPAFIFRERSSAVKGNILEPRHFDALVYPGCLSRNHTYYQDAMNAYRTSEKNGGTGCADMSWSSK